MTVATDWIAAVGTVGTLSTGLVLFAGTMADRRREHANAVSVWTELEEIDRDAFRWEHKDFGGLSIQAEIKIEDWSNLLGPYDFRLRVKNTGKQPIYACQLHAKLNGDVLPSGAYPVRYDVFNADLGILAPAAEMPPKSLLMGAPHRGHDFRETVGKAISFELSFTDTTGRRWSRNEQGHLRRLRKGTAPVPSDPE